MRVLMNLPLVKKLIILFSVTLFGFILILYISFNNLNLMKKNLDITYFGNLMPLLKLESIIDIYGGDILKILYQRERELITLSDTKVEIDTLLHQSLKEWDSYKEIYKSDYELEVINLIDIQINGLISFKDRESNNFIRKMFFIKSLLNNLMEYELFIAKQERGFVNEIYEKTKKHLFIILISIFLISVVITIPILQNIYRTHSELEQKSDNLILANETLKSLSITDSLTELYNRRYFNEIYEKELKRSIREQNDFAFLILDIDFFKKYNDKYGHLKGDEAIKAVAKTIKSTFQRPADYCFRLGGEEFGIITSGLDLNHAQLMADKLRGNIKYLNIEHLDSIKNILTISVGGSVMIPKVGVNIEQFIKKADENLYLAKKDRDRAIITMEVL